MEGCYCQRATRAPLAPHIGPYAEEAFMLEHLRQVDDASMECPALDLRLFHARIEELKAMVTELATKRVGTPAK